MLVGDRSEPKNAVLFALDVLYIAHLDIGYTLVVVQVDVELILFICLYNYSKN